MNTWLLQVMTLKLGPVCAVILGGLCVSRNYLLLLLLFKIQQLKVLMWPKDVVRAFLCLYCDLVIEKQEIRAERR